MIDLNFLESIGEPWRVTADLTASVSNIVVPTPYKRGNTTQAGDRFGLRYGITILAIHYTYVAGAAAVGFDLTASDESYVPGTSRTWTLWQERSQAASRVSNVLTDLWIPLSPALIQPTPVNGASLNLVVTGTAPTSGFLSIFGIHTTKTFGDMGYSGSPAVFPTT